MGPDVDQAQRGAALDDWGDDHRGWLRRHHRPVRYAAAAVILASFCLVVASAATGWTPSTNGLPPNQAGYLWCCGATDVAATWEVPQMVAPNTQAAEGVWIGLQTNDGGFFLQVGTQDNATDADSQYEGFWSDGPLHGSPVNLGEVQPGDVVTARLALAGSTTWAITFADVTAHWSHRRTITYPTAYGHSIAEWIEEDPAEVIPFEKAQLFMMAKTNGTVMRNLEVNGAAPRPFDLQPESFVDGSGTTFSPGSLSHNTFGFRPW